MLEIAFTQHSGSQGYPQQDSLWNGKHLLQESDAEPASLHLAEPSCLFAVSDGVAASRSPAAASRLVIEALAKGGTENRLYGKRVRQIHDALCDRYASGKKRGSSATLVAARVTETDCTVVNVGDSRAYLITGEGNWKQVSLDHTVLNELIASGEISAEEGVTYAQMYDGLAHCLAADYEEYDFPVHYWQGKFHAGDSLLLCSDGLHDALSDTQIKALYNPEKSTHDQVKVWREAVLDAGAPDNLSIVFLRRLQVKE